jgi:hypothetical protein
MKNVANPLRVKVKSKERYDQMTGGMTREHYTRILD